MQHFINDKTVKRWSLVSILIFTLTQILALIPPLIMQRIVDLYIPQNDKNAIFIGILLFVLIPSVYISTQILFNYFAIKFARNKGNEISVGITKNLINQNISFFDTQNSVELVTNSSKEATGYINFYISELPKYYAYIVLSVIIFGILFTYSPYLALIQLLFLPLAIWPIKKIGKTLEKEITQVVTNNAKIAQTRTDIFKGIELVKSLRIEDKKLEEVKNINDDTTSIWGRVAVLDSTTGIWISSFLSMLFTGITFGIGAYLIVTNSGNMTTGTLISTISYIAMLYAYLDTIFKMQINRKKQDAEFAKLATYINLTGESEENQNKKNLDVNREINLKDLEFKYESSDKQILNGINMVFPIGKWTGIVGESGIGKSTIFDLLLGFYKKDNGEILFDNTRIEDISSFSLRDNITRISQDIFMFPGSIKDNLVLGNPNISDAEIQKAIEFANLNNYIESLPNGVDTEIGEAGRLMSGGERQRLSLVQGLLRNNKILLLDEITSNVDENSENIIRENIARLVEDEGYTVISISHTMNFLEKADNIYKM